MNAGDPLIRPPELSKTPMSAMGSKSRYRFAAASPADCSRVESISRCPRAEGGYYTSTWEGGAFRAVPRIYGDLMDDTTDRRGPADRDLAATERKVGIGFAFALVCLGVIGVVSYLSIVSLSEDAAW